MKLELGLLTRIEGHAHLVVDRREGELLSCRLEIVEPPRYFEAMLRGRHFREVAPLAARICGVCSHSHTLVSLRATEAALGVEVSLQTLRLRRLLLLGEILQSHLLHLFFLAAPDHLGVPGLLCLAQERHDLVARALRLKKLANDICVLVGGRAVHPVTPMVGGFALLPCAAELQELRRRLASSLPDLEEAVDLFASFPLPEFARPTTHLALEDAGGYPLFGETLLASSGARWPVTDYHEVIEEYTVPHATARFSRAAGRSYQVGPLARVKTHFESLSPLARQVAAEIELEPATDNPFCSQSARLVEVVHGVEEAIHLVDELLVAGLEPETLAEPQGGGRGAAAVEAPRGTLFHDYEYAADGTLAAANCIIPTAQNLANLEADLAALLPSLANLPEEELTRQAEMLVRSYDPCLSCSTHLVRIRFV